MYWPGLHPLVIDHPTPLATYRSRQSTASRVGNDSISPRPRSTHFSGNAGVVSGWQQVPVVRQARTAPPTRKSVVRRSEEGDTAKRPPPRSHRQRSNSPVHAPKEPCPRGKSSSASSGRPRSSPGMPLLAPSDTFRRHPCAYEHRERLDVPTSDCGQHHQQRNRQEYSGSSFKAVSADLPADYRPAKPTSAGEASAKPRLGRSPPSCDPLRAAYPSWWTVGGVSGWKLDSVPLLAPTAELKRTLFSLDLPCEGSSVATCASKNVVWQQGRSVAQCTAQGHHVSKHDISQWRTLPKHDGQAGGKKPRKSCAQIWPAWDTLLVFRGDRVATPPYGAAGARCGGGEFQLQQQARDRRDSTASAHARLASSGESQHTAASALARYQGELGAQGAPETNTLCFGMYRLIDNVGCS